VTGRMGVVLARDALSTVVHFALLSCATTRGFRSQPNVWTFTFPGGHWFSGDDLNFSP